MPPCKPGSMRGCSLKKKRQHQISWQCRDINCLTDCSQGHYTMDERGKVTIESSTYVSKTEGDENSRSKDSAVIQHVQR